jgi:hypothetical protein
MVAFPQGCPHLREILEIITLLLSRGFRAAHTYERYYRE